MCKKDEPISPSAGTCPTAPVTGAVMPCPSCWPEDYTKEIAVDPGGKYFERYRQSGNLVSGVVRLRQYKLSVPVKTDGDILLEFKIRVEAATSSVLAADLDDAKIKYETGVNFWNNKFVLEIKDEPKCVTKQLKIKFMVTWVTGGEHGVLKVHDTYLREGLERAYPNMNVQKSTSSAIYAHEFGHAFGLPDEYGYTAGETESVKYYKIDGSLDAAISAPHDGKSATAPDATIMGALGNSIILQRHAWPIGIEVQGLLRAKIGAGIICNVL